MSINWRIYQQNTVAARLDRSELPGFFRKAVVVGPNEAAIVVRDGEVWEILTEAKVEVANVFDQFASLFRQGADVTVLFVELAPIDLTIFLGETEKLAFSEETNLDGKMGGALGILPSMKSSHTLELDAAVPPKGTLDKLKNLIPGLAPPAPAPPDQTVSHLEVNKQANASATARRDVTNLGIVAMTADKEVVQAECRIRLRVVPDEARNFIGLMKGKRALATWDLSALLRDELFARVLIPEIATRTAGELRSDKVFLTRLEEQVKGQLEQLLSASGLSLESFSILWGLTEQERADIALRRAEREESARDFVKNRRIAHLMREQEIDQTRITNLQELKMATATGDQEYKDLLLAGEIERHLLEKGTKVDEAHIDAKIRAIRLDGDNKQSIAKLQNDRAEAELKLEIEDYEFKRNNADELMKSDREDKEMWAMVKMQIEKRTSKHEQEIAKNRQIMDADFRRMQADIEDRYQQRKLKLDESMARMGMMERLVGKGLDSNIADASVLNTMLEQSTEQEYATTSDAKVEARSESQSADNKLDTYRAAQEDERAHQTEMTNLSARMMDAAKQNPPPVVVTGSVPQNPPPTQPIVINPSQPLDRGGETQASAELNCPQGHPVQTGWKVCATCGIALVTDKPRCPQGHEVEADWKACPICGSSLDSPSPTCPQGHAVEPTWKACPECGAPL